MLIVIEQYFCTSYSLARGIGFVEVDAGGRGAQGLEHRCPERADGHTDFQVAEVVRAVDGAVAGRNLPEAAIPDVVHHEQALAIDFLADMGAQFAIHCLPDAGVVGKRKSHAADGGGGHQRGQDQAG
ncbi:hypothetical protein G6F40_016764 [Rhizopus arrhizus]|nr:hypothetical protein G6F40_016764 [Rhizopus arrhizus]